MEPSEREHISISVFCILEYHAPHLSLLFKLKRKETNFPNDDYLFRLGIENGFFITKTLSVLTTTLFFIISKHLLKTSPLRRIT